MGCQFNRYNTILPLNVEAILSFEGEKVNLPTDNSWIDVKRIISNYEPKLRDLGAADHQVGRPSIRYQNEAKWMRTYNNVCAKMFGLVEVHRAGYPIRPIVSTINSPTYQLSKMYSKILKNVVGKTNWPKSYEDLNFQKPCRWMWYL